MRKSFVIDKALSKGKIYIATLPYGTGNDGPQTFNWGLSPGSERWNTDIEQLMKELITAENVNLSLWNV